MTALLPNHRYLSLNKKIKDGDSVDPSDPILFCLFNYLANNTRLEIDVEEAYELYNEEEFKHLLNASILGRATDEDINSALNISFTTLNVYRYLFFDIQIFRHNLAIIKYVKTLNCPDEYKLYYTQSIEQGGIYLLNKYRIGERVKENPITIMKTVLNDSYERFLTHRGKPLTNEETLMAMRLGPQIVNGAKQLLEVDKTDKTKDTILNLHLALKTADLTNQNTIEGNIITE